MASAHPLGDEPWPPAGEPPVVWLVVGDKLGDNAQVEAIAEAMGSDYVVKRLRFRGRYVVRRPFFRPSLRHVDIESSDRLEPPWPDLVLTVGRRPSMAALWISKRSRGRTKLVIVGRPRRMLRRFDLVITSAQYRVPDRSNVMQLDLPLMRSSTARMSSVADAWRERLGLLPRPLTAVLLGGTTDPYRFDASFVAALFARANNLLGRDGTLFVTTSRRTPPSVVDFLSSNLPSNARLHVWTPDDQANPYPALLQFADRFIVTGDSISMIVEVARLGKPLAIAAPPLRNEPWQRLGRALSRRFHAADGRSGAFWICLRALVHGIGFVPFSRDFAGFHSRLTDRGLAVNFGDRFPATWARPADELQSVVERVRALVGD
jgi:mitochondrial fission protein ELM1